MSTYHGRAAEAAERILALFESGDVPAALAPVFVHRTDDVPCRKWSWSNQLLTALAGHDDARGYRQWQEVGRYVCKGERGFPILVPLTKRVTVTEDDGQQVERFRCYGFKSQIVFGFAQTDGKPLERDERAERFLEALPLIGVARSWGLSVSSYNGRDGRALGWYRHGQAIAVGVENLATWAHELVHAADDRLRNLTERGQHWRSETVAELGASVLLRCLGYDHDVDDGGCWRYVKGYADRAEIEPITACHRVLKRTCEAVALILADYDKLAATSPATEPEGVAA